MSTDAERLTVLETIVAELTGAIFPWRVPVREYANPVAFEVSGMDVKFREYTQPELDGISDIGREGRMFLDAVEQGFVPKTLAGLVTLLEWIGEGRVNQSGGLTGWGQAIEAGTQPQTALWTWFKAGSDSGAWDA